MIALHNEVATLADEGKTGAAHHHIPGKALVESGCHGFASLLCPYIVNSGEQITNSSLICCDAWLIGHGDFLDESLSDTFVDSPRAVSFIADRLWRLAWSGELSVFGTDGLGFGGERVCGCDSRGAGGGAEAD